MLFRQIFDDKLAQYAYLIGCQRTGEALIVDPERDIDRYLSIAEAEGLRITAVAETHIHADFLSGAKSFAEYDPTLKVYLSDEGDEDWKYEWPDFNDARFIKLKDGDSFNVGKIEVKAVHSPGHTPEHLSYMVIDHGGGAEDPMGMLSGDFVFVGDLGRPDLLETAAGIQGQQRPSAQKLYSSTLEALKLEDHLQIWPAHGAGSSCGKALGAVPQSTVGYERRHNAAIQAALKSESEFVDFILEGQPDPPLYFARMKQENKTGPASYDAIPQPDAMSLETLTERLKESNGKLAIVDTRYDANEYLEGHFKGAIYAPLDKNFCTVVGSFLKPSDQIVLIIEPSEVEEAVRACMRIGLDQVIGYLPVEALEAVDILISSDTTDFAALAKRDLAETQVLDVRKTTEWNDGHIEGAIHIPHTRLASRVDELDASQPVWVHCQSGVRAKAAGSLLEREGFDVKVIDDHFSHWPESVKA